jgi:large subunit ribosomal protein L25
MIKLSAKIRKEIGKKTNKLREEGLIPAILYGPKVDNILLQVDLKEFEKVYKEAGESSLITLAIAKEKRTSSSSSPSLLLRKSSVGEDEALASSSSDKIDKKNFLVLVHAVEMEAISQKPIHVDFYQPNLDEKIISTVPLVFEGEAPAVKNLGGTLLKSIYELEVKAFPQDLPHEIKVDISELNTFEDYILVKDLSIPEKVKIMKDPEETVVFVEEPQKAEEELKRPIEEKIEEVEKSEEKGKKEEKGEENN